MSVATHRLCTYLGLNVTHLTNPLFRISIIQITFVPYLLYKSISDLAFVGEYVLLGQSVSSYLRIPLRMIRVDSPYNNPKGNLALRRGRWDGQQQVTVCSLFASFHA